MPGLRWGAHPERDESAAGARRPPRRAASNPADRVARVRAHAAAWTTLDDAAFGALRGSRVRDRVARAGLDAATAELCCAYAVEAARRALGLAAFDVQIVAALQMQDDRLVEMATGEGKSFAVALAAAIGGLAGVPVHVITANDYLVARDAATFAPLYAALGLGVATVLAPDPPEARRAAYAAPVVYVTAREAAFDYLRDRLAHGPAGSPLEARVAALLDAPATARSGSTAPLDDAPRLLRGLCMAIVDEADSVLIDEATLPLVLSRECRTSAAGRAFVWQAWALSGRLGRGVDFTLDPAARRAALTDAGRARVAALAAALQPAWRNTRHREDTLAQALAARHALHRDVDYVLTPSPADPRAAEVAIVDPATGRVAEGRRWSHGLHAFVSLKEGLRPAPELETLARITFQRFFRRYHRLGGMSGTLVEARSELARVYGLRIVPVAPRLPLRRTLGPPRWFGSDAARWAAVAERAARLSAAGRPVLIGTDSVADSEALVRRLVAAGLAPALLNASQGADEAGVVARAGRAGQVTVSTHMAGRGTDIVPDAAALAAGGLHVIGCQANPSRRLDRQLFGRAGRQGQPGSAEGWISLESPALSADRLGRALSKLIRVGDRGRRGNLGGRGDRGGELARPAWLLAAALALWQRAREARDARRRAVLLRSDRALDDALAFSPIR